MISESEIKKVESIEKLTEEDKLNIFEILIRRFGNRADYIMKEILLLL